MTVCSLVSTFVHELITQAVWLLEFYWSRWHCKLFPFKLLFEELLCWMTRFIFLKQTCNKGFTRVGCLIQKYPNRHSCEKYFTMSFIKKVQILQTKLHLWILIVSNRVSYNHIRAILMAELPCFSHSLITIWRHRDVNVTSFIMIRCDTVHC